MDNYIRKYDNVVSDEFCDGLIEKFEDHPEQQEKLSQGLMSLTFGPHVDSKDANTCKRFLAFFLYLDNNDGGSTMFPQMDITSKCKKGSLLVFPPLWPWLHEGKKPIDKPKYIVGSYLKYV